MFEPQAVETTPRRPLAALCSKIGSGATPRGGASVYQSEGTAFIRSQNVHDNAFDRTGLVRISDDAAAQLKGVEVRPGDILLNITGDSVLRCCLVPDEILPARVSQHVAIIRSNGSVVPRYLQGFLVTPAVRSELLSIAASGATRKAITKAQIESIQIPLQSIGKQQAIAEVLGALDDKIAANARLAATADDLLKVSTDRIASLGQSVPLSSVARFVNGRNFTKDASGSGRMVIRIAELNAGRTGSTLFNDVEAMEDNTARPGDILFAWSGSLTLRRWSLDEGLINQHIFKVLPNDGVPHWLAYQLVRQKLADFKAIAADKATTMGHIQRKHLDEPVRMPRADDVERHHRAHAALWDRALLAERENLTLAGMRDVLLPLLMSGKLRVREAAEMAGL